jgi:hypothetical protein
MGLELPKATWENARETLSPEISLPPPENREQFQITSARVALLGRAGY